MGKSLYTKHNRYIKTIRYLVITIAPRKRGKIIMNIIHKKLNLKKKMKLIGEFKDFLIQKINFISLEKTNLNIYSTFMKGKKGK